MGSKGRRRRRKTKAASVSGGHPEDNTGEDLAATGSLPEKDLDRVTGSRRGLPERYVFPPGWWETHDLYELPDDYYEFAARQIKTDPRYGFGRDTQSQPEHDTDQTIDEDAEDIIAFVNELVRENELFEFKDYLKQRLDIIQPDSDDREIFKILVLKERIHKRYKNLKFQDIVDAINVCIVDLRIKRGWQEDIQLSLMCATFLKNNEGKCFNPFRDLVEAIRQKKYFRRRTVMNYLEYTVQVSGVPLDYDEEQVNAAFSVCGEIVDVKVEPGGPWNNIAYVTFKESEGAKIAPFLVDPARFSVLPIHADRKLSTDSELREALQRYNDFRLKKGGR